MATYKVPQDVEAEDKFLGPLTFKQFLFGSGTLVTGYMIFIFATKGWWVLVISILPFFLVCTAFAFPWSKDQPTDIWLAARIRFMLVPRRRIWDQSGVKDLVQITVPKRQVHIYSDGLSQEQVRSRLNALASIADSRGWAVKNMAQSAITSQISDRLVMPGVTAPPTENEIILNNTVDVMDSRTSPLIQQFDELIKDSSVRHRQETMQKMEQARQTHTVRSVAQAPLQHPATQQPPQNPHPPAAQDDYWFLHELPEPVSSGFGSLKQTGPPPTVLRNNGQPAGTPLTPRGAAHHTKKQHSTKKRNHIKVINPLKRDENGAILADEPVAAVQDQQQAAAQAQMQPQNTSTPPLNPAILTLADNDDLDIATIARQANKSKLDGDEVVVSLR